MLLRCGARARLRLKLISANDWLRNLGIEPRASTGGCERQQTKEASRKSYRTALAAPGAGKGHLVKTRARSGTAHGIKEHWY